jgi:dimethylargininase
MKIAITREVSASIIHCELTHLAREPIDVGLARRQHLAYEERLAEFGCQVQRLVEQPELPDAVFVEDIAVVLDELAVLCRPGAASRRLEIPSVKQALTGYREVFSIDPPGTLDGGDVLRVGKQIYVGLSSRTNVTGISQLETLVQPFGYTVQPVQVAGCLHLKSAVTQAAQNTLLINREWLPVSNFQGFDLVDIDPSEPLAANALLLEKVLIYPAHFPGTRERLERMGLQVAVVEVSELAKAEGGVTCCSLIFNY